MLVIQGFDLVIMSRLIRGTQWDRLQWPRPGLATGIAYVAVAVAAAAAAAGIGAVATRALPHGATIIGGWILQKGLGAGWAPWP